MCICKGLNFGFSMWAFLKIKLYQEILIVFKDGVNTSI